MDNKKLGQNPVFPVVISKQDGSVKWNETYTGMSQRLYIATKAMQALIINNKTNFENNNCISLAKISYKIADELLRQENKEE